VTESKKEEKILEDEEVQTSDKERMNLNDIVFLAIMSALITLVNMITVPIVVAVPLVGVRQLVSAFPHGLLFCIGALKVRKKGAIFIMGFLTGIVLLPIGWIIFAFNVFGATVAEVISLVLFRSYEKDRAVVLGSSLYNPLTMIGSFIFLSWAAEPIAQYVANPALTVFMFLLCFLVSLGGSLVGLRMGESLKKAGKI
jgi:energy-coupling factor transport system substrate-specific component